MVKKSETSEAAQGSHMLNSTRKFLKTFSKNAEEALQRERQMQAKHLWYNVDIRWSDLKDKLEVLAPTGEDVEDVKQKWEAKKHYFAQYKKDGCRPPCIDWIRQFKALTLTTLQHIRQ